MRKDLPHGQLSILILQYSPPSELYHAPMKRLGTIFSLHKLHQTIFSIKYSIHVLFLHKRISSTRIHKKYICIKMVTRAYIQGKLAFWCPCYMYVTTSAKTQYTSVINYTKHVLLELYVLITLLIFYQYIIRLHDYFNQKDFYYCHQPFSVLMTSHGAAAGRVWCGRWEYMSPEWETNDSRKCH